MRKRDSFRRWLARARQGKPVPREVLEGMPRLVARLGAGRWAVVIDDYAQTFRFVM